MRIMRCDLAQLCDITQCFRSHLYYLYLISVAGVIFGEDAARGAIQGQLYQSIGSKSALAVQEMIESARRGGNSILMTVVGFLILLFTASGVFAQLKDAMNVVWEVRPDPKYGF